MSATAFEAAPLRGLDAASRARVQAAGRDVPLRDGQILFETGDDADALFVVLRGRILIEGDGNLVEGLTVIDTPGDGIRANDVDGITFRGVTVGWSAEAAETNGAYALYPVQSSNVTIQDCIVYGAADAGAYLGQRIPFSIHPLGTLGLGNSQGVPVLADNDCAERLWSVNAAVLGQDVFQGRESSITRLDLLKRNTFYSQWCSPPTGADEFQVATVRPEVNLLLDPADPNRQPVAAGSITGESRGRMQPYLNVDRAEFEKAEYEQGSTEELAGRGLYGDYALFIPRSVLNLDGRPGLRLDRIEDILLRLDYVSVARD